jgi:hypothetical protein
MADVNPITVNYFLDELKKRVSPSSAKLLLHTAVVRSGLIRPVDAELSKEEAQTLCLELIKTGGPGFQVGRSVYSQMTR